MPRHFEGTRPLTLAENDGRGVLQSAILTVAQRQARYRERRSAAFDAMRAALERVAQARTIKEAREIALAELATHEGKSAGG